MFRWVLSAIHRKNLRDEQVRRWNEYKAEQTERRIKALEAIAEAMQAEVKAINSRKPVELS